MKRVISFYIVTSLFFVIWGFYNLPGWIAIPALFLWLWSLAGVPSDKIEEFDKSQSFKGLEREFARYSDPSREPKRVRSPSITAEELFEELDGNQQQALRALYDAIAEDSGTPYDFKSWLGEMTVVVSEGNGERFIFPALSVFVEAA